MTSYQLPPEPLGERLTRTETDLAHVVKQVDAMAAQMQHITKVLDQAQGGWKAMVWVGSISGAVGGALVKVFPWLTNLPR